ncbi:MAG: hypothetical protein A3B91_00250 [Candidatus Yanofskybacteria bacterium RIFCSPHIGHO2_02_FULL_41_29]|nr:MAG: hypothetical protein A3B91_00250 [Candidatus Yanofskybacteria bacterium RIFCSPHIGHO2_02_FULL_41_29]OGN22815.1 MAG: hypothetical protein A2916_01845 [Candidatus Yanofskybacteria bacterium RIFCSPLOWO2_01_FULL_41_67]OGN30082.1 MAG: hypothetical protein A3H54_02890 [Candidatus Yanofskybacteria bacterium RIFCSPLOWO2_02_FULL_41_13]OGN35132.1 MAG: hypothetical protein A3F98_00330 [Candidatus Yanofskybacteria bacterium RIFCSPLOWO2_12_FULL_41_8]
MVTFLVYLVLIGSTALFLFGFTKIFSLLVQSRLPVFFAGILGASFFLAGLFFVIWCTGFVIKTFDYEWYKAVYPL